MKKKGFVLDSYALLAYFQAEQGLVSDSDAFAVTAAMEFSATMFKR